MLPLDGITVVTLEQAVAAPFASRQLADLGARVIKIERPGAGDFARGYDRTVRGLSSHFVWLNRSKESLALDLKRPEAQDVLGRLLGRADVFLQNLAPGSAKRLGLEHESLRRRFPRLIVCRISGYGPVGPYRAKKAYDLLIQAETGLVSITGTEATPSKVGISVADIAAGMYAYSGILTALIVRAKTSEGTFIDVSLFDALAEWMGYPLYFAKYGGSAPRRTGASHATIAPYGPFQAGDGTLIYLAVQNEREWVRFCDEVLRRPALALSPAFGSNTARIANRDQVESIVNEAFGALSAGEILNRLERADIAHTHMNTMQEFMAHPQLEHRWGRVSSSVGPLDVLMPPVSIEDTSVALGPVPDVGQHTNAILGELGYDVPTIERWRTLGLFGRRSGT